MKPLFATYSPIYKKNTEQKQALHKVFNYLKSYFPDINNAECTTSFHDDLIAINKNHGFLDDKYFIEAVEPFINDAVVMSKIWRIYTYAQQALDTTRDSGGTLIDFGCYDYKTVEIALRYILAHSESSNNLSQINIYLFDAFENPPTGAKSLHGPQLLQNVSRRMSYLEERFNITYIKGYLPDSLTYEGLNIKSENICFAHVDLNNGKLDAECLEYIFPSVRIGGSILFDDFGFSNYKDSMYAINKSASKLNCTVLEIPTGQGLTIKRS